MWPSPSASGDEPRQGLPPSSRPGSCSDGMRRLMAGADAASYVQTIAVGQHRLTSDEPPVAGADEDLNPSELVLAALGACKGRTVSLYAERKQWPLQAVRVILVL